MQKTAIVVSIVLLVACLAALGSVSAGSQMSLAQFMGGDTEAARQVGEAIAAYKLPPGYQEQESRDIGLIKMVAITPEGQAADFLDQNLILVTTVPEALGIGEEAFQQELRLALLRSSDGVSSLELVGEQSVSGQNAPITMRLYETFREDDRPTRIMISDTVPGEQARVILVFAAPIAQWDQGAIDAFVESLNVN